MYVKLNLFIRRDLSSKHSLALYEVLKDYQNIKKIRIDIDDFRKIVGLEPEQYKIFTMLKKRVIEVAVEEINEKTDLKISYDLEKQGRKIVAIHFEVTGTSLHEEQSRDNSDILAKLEEYGIRKTQALKLIEERDEDYILANIRIVEEELQNGKGIRNVAAYLMKAFQVDFRPVETPYDKAKKAEQLQAAQDEQAAKAKEKEQQELQKAFDKKKDEAVENLLKGFDQTDLKSLKEEFTTGIKDNPLFSKMLESKGFDSPVLQVHRKRFLAENHLPQEVYDFDFYLQQLENGAVEYVSESGLNGKSVSQDANLKSL